MTRGSLSPRGDAPSEPPFEDTLDQTVADGYRRLARPWNSLLATGLMGGLEVGTGVLAYLFVLHETGSPLLAGLAFSIGFVALLLGHSELFTEDFLVPVTAAVAGHGTGRSLLRLWLATLVMNLAGGYVIMWLIVQAFPELDGVIVESGTHFVELGVTLRSFCLAVLAGAAMTLMTWMQRGAESGFGRIVAAVSMGFLISATELFHSVLDSLLMFGALHTGKATFGYLDWLSQLGWATFGNIVGGIGLVTAFRLVQGHRRVQQHRRPDER